MYDAISLKFKFVSKLLYHLFYVYKVIYMYIPLQKMNIGPYILNYDLVITLTNLRKESRPADVPLYLIFCFSTDFLRQIF